GEYRGVRIIGINCPKFLGPLKLRFSYGAGLAPARRDDLVDAFYVSVVCLYMTCTAVAHDAVGTFRMNDATEGRYDETGRYSPRRAHPETITPGHGPPITQHRDVARVGMTCAGVTTVEV
ncbi:hypothetical protein, partial [Promicromonospora umidemergens]|uniref:hypothetical protein n=1 Tax=Promicromonospora umidemergens TaxID=629679 RepID=UPI0031F1516E